jgi:hypothetical protein
VAGGWNGGAAPGGWPTTAEIFDPATNSFSPVPNPMTVGRQGATAVLLGDGRVLIAGGYNPSVFPGSWLQSAEVFNPANNTFTAVGNMTTVRSVPAGAPLPGGGALIAGGFDGLSAPQQRNSAEVFASGGSSFSAAGIGVMGTRRSAPFGAPLADGHVLVGGGSDGSIALKSAELFDSASKTFTPTGSMAVARQDAAASPLPDGRVLVTGGTGMTAAGQSAEVFDPATGSFSSTGIGQPPTSLFDAGAAPLPDGRVLIVGGNAGSGPVRTAQTFSLTPPSTSLSFQVQGKLLQFNAPVAGTISVAQAGGTAASAAKKRKKRRAPSRLLASASASGGPGTITIALQPLGKANKKLKRKGRVAIPATLTFTPKGGGCVAAFRQCYSSLYTGKQGATLLLTLPHKKKRHK